MRGFIKYSILLIVFVLTQGLVVGQIDFGLRIHPMIYILFLLILPFEIKPIPLLIIGFITGIGVDFFMNTFGLHASSAVLIAGIRPFIYQQFAPRDGYDLLHQPILRDMGLGWFIKTATILTSIHHLWFFALEYLKVSAWKEIISSTIFSSVISLLIFIVVQILFFNKSKNI